MAEQDMRAKVVKLLKPIHAIAVENRVLPGTPDVNYIDGWVELKWLRNWPQKPETPVVLDHYTPQQKIFCRRRTLAGGKSFVLLQVKREWLLFSHPATMEIGKLTRQELYDSADKVWTNGINKEELIKCLN